MRNFGLAALFLLVRVVFASEFLQVFSGDHRLSRLVLWDGLQCLTSEATPLGQSQSAEFGR